MTESWSILTEAAVRAAVLGLGAGALLLVWRRRSPATTQGVWIAIVLGMLALPLLNALAPRLALRVPVSVSAGSPAQVLEADTEATSASPSAVPVAVRRNETATPVGLTSVPAVAADPARQPAMSWPELLTGLYLGVSTLMLLLMVRGLWTLRRLARSAREIDDPGLRRIAAELVADRAVRIVASPAVHVPITAGLLRPRVFLPESWRSWSGDKLRAVLAHELSHVRRGDFLWIVLAELNKCLYWFHPLAWIARRRLAAFAEEASDADAAARVGSTTAYARVLVEIAALVRGEAGGRVAHGLVAVPMASSSELSRRVENVLRGGGRRAPSRRARIAAATVLVSLVVAAGTLELVARPGDPPEPEIRPEIEAEPEVAVPAVPQVEVQAEPEIEVQAEPEIEVQAEPEIEVQAEPEIEVQAEPKVEVGPVGPVGQVGPVRQDRPDPEPEIATNAPPATSLDRLIAELSDPDPERRARAAAELGEDEAYWDAAIPHLVALLGDDARIRRSAWRSGRGQRWVPARRVWDHPSPGETATIVLASMSRRAAAALAGVLDHGDPVVRRNAAWGLGELRHPRGIPEHGIEALTVLLDDPDATVRAASAWALGDIRVRRATDQLIEALLHDRNAGVRAEAAHALGEIRAAAAENALARVARQSLNPKVRYAARQALREVREHGY